MSAPADGLRLPRKGGQDERLAARVLGCVPATQPAFLKLLGLLDIRASREIATACVTLGARSHLLLNPDFIDRHCRTAADLRLLVMHELLHVLLGHTRLYQMVTPAQNWAFDALINAQLCLLFPEPEQTALLRRLYDAERFPEALLRPPPGWRTARERWPLEGAAGQAHRALYSERQLTESELFALLEKGMAGTVLGTSRLLGNHALQGQGRQRDLPARDQVQGNGSGESPGDGQDPDPDFIEAVERIIAEWPMVERRGGRDLGGLATVSRIEPAGPRWRAVNLIRRALLPLCDQPAGGEGTLRPRTGLVEGLGPLRSRRDRRAAVRELLGETPLLYRTAVEERTLAFCNRIHLYLDASGSMDFILPLLYGALLPLRPWLHEQVHLFSTEVCDIDLDALRAGKVMSTGGTSIDCVSGHLVREGVRRALILTDGVVGRIPGVHRKPLSRCRVRVVLTSGGDPAFAEEMGWPIHRLPELEEKR